MLGTIFLCAVVWGEAMGEAPLGVLVALSTVYSSTVHASRLSSAVWLSRLWSQWTRSNAMCIAPLGTLRDEGGGIGSLREYKVWDICVTQPSAHGEKSDGPERRPLGVLLEGARTRGPAAMPLPTVH